MDEQKKEKTVPPPDDAAQIDRAAVPEGDVHRLVERAQEGDQMAFELLYRTHVERVYALCLRLTADVAEAERLTQDTFVQAWRKLTGFRREAAFSTWLYRLTVNTVWQDRRASKRRRRWIANTDADEALNGWVQPRASEAAIDLERAIAALPERARMVFVLHDVEGYRHEEIAEMMSTSTGTSKAQLHRARALLRKVLDR